MDIMSRAGSTPFQSMMEQAPAPPFFSSVQRNRALRERPLHALDISPFPEQDLHP
jgi:hypothetical protein